MELGICTFADMPPDPVTGKKVTAHQRLQELLEEIKLADEIGLDVFAVGEHHRKDYAASSPAVILGAAAAITKNIKLSSGVTVLSSDDPVRVFQQFSTVDLLSNGRAEIMAGRGSFTESFPLFGYHLGDYDTLFSEKLELLLKINEQEKITWSGKHRAAISDLGIYPRPQQDKLPIWIAIGGTPQSVQRAAMLGLPLTIAIIGGSPDRFAPYVNYYRQLWKEAGHEESQLQVGINSHTYVADSSKQAADEFYPGYADVMTRIGGERGWPPMNRDNYDMMREPEGSLMVGSAQQVIDKILYEYELFHHTRYLAQIGVGTMPHEKIMRAIELFGTVVAPAVRKALNK
jgi:probable LLM family oxidoreductase